MEILWIIAVIIVLLVVFYFLDRWLFSILPSPWGRILGAVLAVLAVIFVLLPLIGIHLQ